MNSSHAVAALLSERWPGVDLIALVAIDSSGKIPAVDSIVSVEDHCYPYEPRSLTDIDQIVVALPSLLLTLIESYESVIWCGPDILPTGNDLPEFHRPVTLAMLPRFRSVDSLTPELESSMYPRPSDPVADLVVVRNGAADFLQEWRATCVAAVVDVDQRLVKDHSHEFIARAVSRDDVGVDGANLVSSWVGYASVGAGRSIGSPTSFVSAPELFTMEREARSSRGLDPATEDLEVEWPMLVHRVHDSRPIEFLRDAIVATPDFGPSSRLVVEEFIADVRRAVDPFGNRWVGEGSTDEVRAWLLETNQFGMSRASDLVIRSTDLWERFPRARYAPKEFHDFLDGGGLEQIEFDPRTLEPAPRSVRDGEMAMGRSDRLRWRWNILKQLAPRALDKMERAYIASITGEDPGPKRGVAPPKRLIVNRESSMWGAEPRPLTVMGCFRAESGLGEAARASLLALRQLNRTFTHIDTSDKYPSRNSAPTGLDWSTYGNTGDVNLIHSNAHEMVDMAHHAFRHRFGGRFNAAMWFWETADLPSMGRLAFDVVDELWVASEYLVDVFGQYAQVPVHSIGLASDLPSHRTVDRSALGLHNDDFIFLFVYDALSSYGRKNPVRAIQAFINAFGPTFSGVRFILKVTNLNKFPASQAEIMALKAKYPAIEVIDQYLDRDDVLDLMATADVYVSLHSAEGYGLTLLEAMALGTPTICTGYSGNMDFTSDTNSWLVDYEIVSTDEQTGPYPVGSIWARPSLESATSMMRQAFDDRAGVAAKAGLARSDALEAASLEKYAARLDAELRRVGA